MESGNCELERLTLQTRVVGIGFVMDWGTKPTPALYSSNPSYRPLGVIRRFENTEQLRAALREMQRRLYAA